MAKPQQTIRSIFPIDFSFIRATGKRSGQAPARRSSYRKMHRSRFRRLGGAVLVGLGIAGQALLPSPASAQESPNPGAAHRVATIDVGYIFKNQPSIQAQVKKIESDLKAYETVLLQKREAVKQAVEKLKTLKPGSPDFIKQEELAASLDSQLRLDMSRRQMSFRTDETKIYYDNYQRIIAAVETIAKHNKIQLVMRSNSEEMDLDNANSVTSGVMKNVVFRDDAIDMTNMVMQYLQQSAATQANAAPSGSVSR